MSKGNYAALNVSATVGDCPEAVEENLRLLKNTLDLPSITQSTQCHKTDFFIATKNNRLETPSCDILMTREIDVPLLTKHADCQVAILYDPVQHAVANVHAGWRGMVQDVYAKAITLMTTHYGSRAEDLIACISPSLGPTASEFLHYEKEFPQIFWPFQWKPYHFNLWNIARWQLQSSGVRPENIEIASLCTYAHPEDFFSYRYNKQTGRNATISCLR